MCERFTGSIIDGGSKPTRDNKRIGHASQYTSDCIYHIIHDIGN
jgi:hypothetical protein